MVVDIGQTLLQYARGRTALDANHEQPREPLQRILVHGVDQRKVDYAEEQERGAVGHWTIPLASLIDLFLSDFALLYSLVNLLTGFLGVRKLVNQRFIFKKFVDVAVCAR